MTPWDLQKSLIAEIEELLAQMQLKNVAGEDVFGVRLRTETAGDHRR